MAISPHYIRRDERLNQPDPCKTSLDESLFHLPGAFSLIELLVVVAITGLLAGLAIPAFNSIGQSRGIADAAYQMAAAVEFARSEAIARQTYVWMGIQPVTDAGGDCLLVGMVYSKDGSGTNTASSNLQPMGKPLVLQRVGVVDASGVNVNTNLGALKSFSSLSNGLSFSVGRMTGSSGQSITFTPTGEVVLSATASSSTGFEPRIGIGLSQIRGSTFDLENSAVVVIDGSVGGATIYRK